MNTNLKYILSLILLISCNGSLSAKNSPNLLRYGSCDEGKKGWYSWTGSGSIEVETDPEGLNSGKGVKIIAKGDPVKGSVSMPFNYRGKVIVSGYALSTTETSSKVSLQCFDSNSKTIAWIDIAFLKTPGKKTLFSKTVVIPENAAKTNLAVNVTSAGSVRVDDLKVTPANLLEETSSIEVPTVNEVTIQRIKSVETDQPLIALTFDDGPNDLSPDYLDLFAQEGIKATFFCKGNSVASRPEIARRIVNEGHEVGNHSYSHPRFNQISDAEAYKQVIDTQAIIEETTGTTATLFRAPYILYTPKLMEILQATGLQPIDCSVGVSDWHEDTTVELIIERATTDKTKAGTIILMHDWSPKSLEALPTVIETLRERGYRFVTVSELLAAAN
ncbi:polysaccharide deacetylase family protein [Puniceicoccus vermicola]|uniref:Polysaccharide deacetylase family protein n=1 Tax=Puniceicoccus vermicola TaxID=388746 RepID=A0A7X1AZG5_9BACT|nr:polysaccharide deacetylase family protein [Puniceicoccus vermicola]MBC2602806.1 polysaccharide deacetylase family protein [Puniceicoccus vermicola]